jgi:DNA-binding NtrC family response regulator
MSSWTTPWPDKRDEPVLSLGQVEREHIIKTLDHTGWNITRTAEILGISRPTLRLKIREYKIEKRPGI